MMPNFYSLYEIINFLGDNFENQFVQISIAILRLFVIN